MSQAPAARAMTIRFGTDADQTEIVGIHRAAFGSDAEPALVAALLADPTAAPLSRRLADLAGPSWSLWQNPPS